MLPRSRICIIVRSRSSLYTLVIFVYMSSLVAAGTVKLKRGRTDDTLCALVIINIMDPIENPPYQVYPSYEMNLILSILCNTLNALFTE